jgi:hypothetical protein
MKLILGQMINIMWFCVHKFSSCPIIRIGKSLGKAGGRSLLESRRHVAVNVQEAQTERIWMEVKIQPPLLENYTTCQSLKETFTVASIRSK